MLSHYPARNVALKTHTYTGPAKKMVLQFLQFLKYTLWVVPSLSHLLHKIRPSPRCETNGGLSLTSLRWCFSGNVTGKMLKWQNPSLESAEHPHSPLI